jgi:hypothetical protein
MKSHVFGSALLSVIAIVVGAPTHAQNGSLTRSFVSSTGLDTNACTIAAPCASFAQAYTKVGANGIVAALDPGKYGPISIIGPVTINGNGWAAITGPSGSNGIYIDAGPTANVTLIGLEIDGANAASNGILLISAGRLDVINCALRNFTHDGIYLEPATVLFISILDAIASDNGNDGIDLSPFGAGGALFGDVSHSTATGNSVDGMNLWGANSTYGVQIAAAVTFVNCIASNNGQSGFVAHTISGAGNTIMTLRDSVADYNAGSGIIASGSASIILAHNEATANSYGVQNASSNSVFSFGDNHFSGNLSNDAIGTLSSASFH